MICGDTGSNGVYRLRDCGGLSGTAHPKCGKEGTEGVNDTKPPAVSHFSRNHTGTAHIGFVRLLLFKKVR